jgi:hypothetical protein
MTWTNGTVLKAGTVIYQIAEPVDASGVVQTVTIKNSSGVVLWQGNQGDRWSSTKGWTITEDLTVELASAGTAPTTPPPPQTIVKGPAPLPGGTIVKVPA